MGYIKPDFEYLKEEIRKCKNCGLSETRTYPICGEGNLDAEIMLIAQAPGEKEDKMGRMFIGPSGKVLDELLAIAEVERKELFMTNLLKCKLPGYRRPKQYEIEKCSIYLDMEIELIDPQIIVPMGFFATSYVFSKYSLPSIRESGSNTVFGRLYLTYDRKVFPIRHPSVVLHNPSNMEQLAKNFRKLKIITHECKWYQSCPLKRFYEEGNLSREWVELYCKGDWESCILFQIVERGESRPDWMLPDGSIDERLYKLYR